MAGKGSGRGKSNPRLPCSRCTFFILVHEIWILALLRSGSVHVNIRPFLYPASSNGYTLSMDHDPIPFVRSSMQESSIKLLGAHTMLGCSFEQNLPKPKLKGGV